ncbi:phage virion morphogenesis protein [Thermodesulfitimonas autotrophica]|uniref:phage virion morphogenesis protein n=1 Tax=Thermodesulfitimonas autotrophica TaxID=1894989 RepID=UPI002FE3D4FF
MAREGLQIQGDFLAVERRLERLAMINFTAIHREIGEYILGTVHDRFKKGEGPDGKKWPASYRAKAEGGQTLVDTRHFQNSFDYRERPDRVDVGTNWPYARVHQEGRVIKPRKARALRFRIGDQWAVKKQVKIPARPVLGLNNEDQAEIREIVAEAIRRAIE